MLPTGRNTVFRRSAARPADEREAPYVAAAR